MNSRVERQAGEVARRSPRGSVLQLGNAFDGLVGAVLVAAGDDEHASIGKGDRAGVPAAAAENGECRPGVCRSVVEARLVKSVAVSYVAARDQQPRPSARNVWPEQRRLTGAPSARCGSRVGVAALSPDSTRTARSPAGACFLSGPCAAPRRGPSRWAAHGCGLRRRVGQRRNPTCRAASDRRALRPPCRALPAAGRWCR